MTMFRINAGKYRHIITLQKLVAVQNGGSGYGGYGEIDKDEETNWEDVLTTRAGIFPVSGKDYYSVRASVDVPEITHKIQMRYQSGVDSKMRVKFGNRIFDIISPPIDFQEKHIELQLMCKERMID